MALQLSLFENERKIILISLMEKYYISILAGEKKFEYRTKLLNEPCIAYIYVAKTKKSILAKIEFGVLLQELQKKLLNSQKIMTGILTMKCMNILKGRQLMQSL